MQDYIEELYSKYSMYLLYIIKNRLYEGCPKDIAYDILDEVFEAALKKKDKSPFMDNPKAWLTATAKRKADNYNRTADHRSHQLVSDSSLTQIPRQKDLAKDTVCRNFLENDFHDFFQKKLSKDEKYLYYLKYQEHLDETQISEKLHISPDTASAKLSQLQTKIRQFIKKNIN